jgi:hypothetical protein
MLETICDIMVDAYKRNWITSRDGWLPGKMLGYQGGTGTYKKGKKYDK